MRLDELADKLGLPLSGQGDLSVEKVAPLDSAKEGDISFFIADRVGETSLANTNATAIILPEGTKADLPHLLSKNPLYDAARAKELLTPEPEVTAGVDKSSVVAATAVIDKSAHIGPLATIGANVKIGKNVVIGSGVRVGANVTIGARSKIFDNTVIYHGSIIGADCRIEANVTIGSDGFGYAPIESGKFYKIPQTGIVRVEDNVDIGASCTIDRATFTETVIRTGVRIDDQVHIGHNCDIGENCVIAGCTGVSGSVKIGKNVIVGGQVAIKDHVTICDGVRLAGRTAVYNNITEPGIYAGERAMKNIEHKRSLLLGKRLEKLENIVKALKNHVTRIAEVDDAE